MNKFIVSFTKCLLESITSASDPVSILELGYVLGLREAIDAAAENPAWSYAVDQQSEFDNITIRLFMQAGRYEQFPMVNTRLARLTELIQLPHTILAQNQDAIYANISTLSEEIQKCSFEFLTRLIKLNNQEYSLQLEMGQVNDEEEEKLSLFNFHKSLVATLNSIPENRQSMFGYLIAWMLVFDHFEDSTFELKVLYSKNLKALNVIDRFLNFVCFALNVGNNNKAFDLTGWQFNEPFLIEAFDGSTMQSVQLLCAHLYWRSISVIPSLVRTWFMECKKRMLTVQVESYTETYFTPLLISSQFQNVDKTEDDFVTRFHMTNKEITTMYTVDENEIEMVIHIPSCYPLRMVQVGGGKRLVGVPEDRWRLWLLTVTKVISIQNGSVIDSIEVYKKNVKMHFQGIEDCAICYSVIGMVDKKLPNKECKVCKHKFHGPCLYEWFRKSNQNTCPLCRQVF
jgi:hypothetical protein